MDIFYNEQVYCRKDKNQPKRSREWPILKKLIGTNLTHEGVLHRSELVLVVGVPHAEERSDRNLENEEILLNILAGHRTVSWT